MNNDFIEKIKNASNIDTATHSGSYELVSEGVARLSKIPIADIDVNDLVMLFEFGNLGFGKIARDNKIKESSLPDEDKQYMLALNERINDGEYSNSNYEKHHKSNGNCGLFSRANRTLHQYADKSTAQNFIRMLIEISKLEDTDEIYRVAEEGLAKNLKGIKAAIASQILHLLKPNVFPILNKVGQGYKNIVGLPITKEDDIHQYIRNAKIIKKFRDSELPGLNFRTIDIMLCENTQDDLDEYSKFKKLLEWFVNQLDINNKVKEGKRIFGEGYKEKHSIRQFYKNFNDYDDFILQCTLAKGFQSANRSNYINYESFNVIPEFNRPENSVKSLYLGIHRNKEKKWEEKSDFYEIADLGLFDEKEPNQQLVEFFDLFKKELKIYKAEIKTKSEAEEPENGVGRVSGGKNIIFYGVPGCGKSFAIKSKVADEVGNAGDVEECYETLGKNGQICRVVFHPDYTYSDFTGQILPKTNDGKVEYEFTPGPFTLILEKAINNPDKHYFLVIEEMNRGNAAAIFGDLFQLLDRKDCESEYRIDSVEIGKHIDGIQDDDDRMPDQIFIPENLWILATMNTSDQNVFTLDTAFQRRWDMELIPNQFSKEHDFIIQGTDVTWRTFAEGINNLLKEAGAMTSEDKRLGAWFVKADGDNEISKKHFANKVLKYLWDDAFKFNRDELFRTDEYYTLEDVIASFCDKGKSFDELFDSRVSFATRNDREVAED